MSIRELKAQCRALIRVTGDLQRRYMELESDLWHWEKLEFEDFAKIPDAMLEILEGMRPRGE